MERIQKYINRIYRASILDRAAFFAGEGLAGQDPSYLLWVCRSPGCSQDALAAGILVHKSTVARNVARLERLGYIRRETGEEDRRERKLYPTERAFALYPRILDYLEGWNEELTEALSEKDQEALLRLLQDLTRRASARARKLDRSEETESVDNE